MQSGSKERPILMTTDSVGGVWHYSLSLISELADHGLPVVLAVMGRRLNKSQQWQVAKLKNVELRESDFPLEWMDRPWSEIDRAAEWLQSLAANYHVRLVHLNQLSFGAVEFSVPRIVVAHSCVY